MAITSGRLRERASNTDIVRFQGSTQPTGIDFATIPLELNSHNDSELVKIEWIRSGLDKLVDVLNLFFVTMYLLP
jgi:hypothetical protein